MLRTNRPDRALTSAPLTWYDVRYIGAVAGRYTFSKRPADEDGQIPVYACRMCSISTRHSVVLGPVTGVKGETVSAHFDDFGILRGNIARKLPSGFVMELELADDERSKLRDKIIWRKKHATERAADQREHKRVLPREPRTVLTLADGTQMPCFVIDVSQSGIAVSAELAPRLGTPMAIGKLVGRVVRYLDVGFALQFVHSHQLSQLEQLMTPPVRTGTRLDLLRNPG